MTEGDETETTRDNLQTVLQSNIGGDLREITVDDANQARTVYGKGSFTHCNFSDSDCVFLIAYNGLYRIEWECSHIAIKFHCNAVLCESSQVNRLHTILCDCDLKNAVTSREKRNEWTGHNWIQDLESAL